MAHRREEKERLRQERLAREQAAKEAARRKRLVGYGIGGALALAALVVVVVLLVAGGGDGDGEGGEVFPSGGTVPDRRTEELRPAARAAGCELESVRADSRDHVPEGERVRYSTNPPSEGRHAELPAEDGLYTQSPDLKALVHSLEHGRVVLWVRRNAPSDVRADMRALFDQEQGFQLLLTPSSTRVPYLVAASAWGREPEPLGTGHILTCRTASARTFDALQAFIEEHRGNGPEPVP